MSGSLVTVIFFFFFFVRNRDKIMPRYRRTKNVPFPRYRVEIRGEFLLSEHEQR